MAASSIDWRECLEIRTNGLKFALDESPLNLFIRGEINVPSLLDGCLETEDEFVQSWH